MRAERGMRIARGIYIAVILASLLAFPRPGAGTEAPLLVLTAIPPHAFLIGRIGGDAVKVETMVPPGSSPHSFEPTPRQIARASSARAYFEAGVEAERLYLPKMRAHREDLAVIDMNDGIRLRSVEGGEHGHGEAGASDPHVWLSPRLAIRQARNICEGLTGLDGKNRSLYEGNLARLEKELGELDLRIARRLEGVKGRTFYVIHPSFGYFADEYGIRQAAIEPGGKEPGAKHMAGLIDRARSEGVKVIFVEPQFSMKSADIIARATGSRLVRVDPLSGDYVANMERIADEMARALKEAKR